jgi:cellulose synthase/poly-beta-1,6-N-acetylglucosamine synthase-like glycosyltransferase
MDYFKVFFLIMEIIGFVYIGAFLVSNTALFVTSATMVLSYFRRTRAQDLCRDNDSQLPPISILVPAYNEEAVIVDSLKLLFKMDYPEFEIVVSNDGSSDNTMEVLKENFDLYPVAIDNPQWVTHKPVVGVWKSTVYPNLTVVDKVNGRKADAMNAALNFSRYPLYCCIDADSYIRKDGFRRCIQPFLNDPRVVGVGCGLRVMEGAKVDEDGNVVGYVPSNLLAAFQTLEYLRAFLLVRIGWTFINASPLISGAFALYRKDIVLEAGGYRANCMGDDSDMTLRVHQHCSLIKPRPYRIRFIPEPICWTQVPTDAKSLFNQRIRWQWGCIDGIFERPDLFLNPKQFGVGFGSIPYLLLFNYLDPIMNIVGMFFLVVGYIYGFVSLNTIVLMASIIYTYWLVICALTVLLEEVTFKSYRGRWDILKLFGLGALEGFGYYQFNIVARLIGIYRHMTNQTKVHGHIQRQTLAIKERATA